MPDTSDSRLSCPFAGKHELADVTLRSGHRELEARIAELTAELETANLALREQASQRQRAESWSRQLFDLAPDAMLATNGQGQIVLVNLMAERLFGYAREELLGQMVEILIPEKFRCQHVHDRAGYLAQPHVRAMGAKELFARRKDGSEFPVEISLGPMETERGPMVLCAVRDISARRQVECALRESQDRFSLAVEGTDAGIWDWDLRSNRVYFSPRWKSMLGYESEEIGDEFEEWENRLHPEDRERALQTVRAYLKGESSSYELEHRLRHKDGTFRWILARGAAHFDEQGSPYRMVGSLLDVTTYRATLEALRERETQLRAAQRIQERLLPRRPPALDDFDVAGASFAAEFAAGDYFDYLIMPDGTLTFVIADVSGHGVGPALLMASVCAHLRSFVEAGMGIVEMLSRTNRALEQETEIGHFVTATLVHLDPQTRTVHYVNAGHPASFVLDASGRVKGCMESTALPLAIARDAGFAAGSPMSLESGDVILMLTDGVSEAQSPSGELFGTDRVLDVFQQHRSCTPEELIQRLYQSARGFSRNGKLVDDFTAVVVKAK